MIIETCATWDRCTRVRCPNYRIASACYRVVFWRYENKRRDQPYSIVFVSVPRFGPSLTTGVLEVGFTTQRTIMADRRQPWEQLSSHSEMLSSAWLSKWTAVDTDVHVCDSYPGGAHPGDYNQFPIVTLHYCVCVVWRQCHAKCN